jgi:hypothetical protein
MAELTTLESKIGEVLGLAMAAKKATDKIEKLVEDDGVRRSIQRMHDDAAKIEELGTELIGQYEGKKTAILEKARETKNEATEMMETYLGDDADGLDGLEFLTMAEAGEVGHWNVVAKLNEQAQDRELQELIDFVVPMQESHFRQTLEGSLVLAAAEDPNAPA